MCLLITVHLLKNFTPDGVSLQVQPHLFRKRLTGSSALLKMKQTMRNLACGDRKEEKMDRKLREVAVVAVLLGLVGGVGPVAKSTEAATGWEKNEAAAENMDLNNKGKSQAVTGSAEQHDWKAIGKYGCHGLPYVHQDPKNPDNYIITWQRYIYRPAGNIAMDVKFAIYNAKTRTISPERYVFDPRNITIKQGHPCWGYSHGKYRIFYCQKSREGNHIAEVTADKWSDFQNYKVSNNEPVISPKLSCGPFKEFLALDSSTAWLFYENWQSNEPDLLSYGIFKNGKG